MKKLLFLFSVIILTLTSCSSQDEPQMEQIAPAKVQSELLTEIKHYNDSLMSLRDENSRGWITTVLQVCAVAAADASGAWSGAKIGGYFGGLIGPQGATIGASVGAVIVGAGRSYHMYKLVRNDDIPDFNLVTSAYADLYEDNEDLSNYYPTKVHVQYDKGQEVLFEVGAKHNAILYRLFSDSIPATTSYDGLKTEEVQILNNPDFRTEYYESFDGLVYRKTDTYFPNELTESDQVMKQYVSLLSRYPRTEFELAEITSKYVQLLNANNTLSQEEKDKLISSIFVAVTSYEFWDSKRVNFGF